MTTQPATATPAPRRGRLAVALVALAAVAVACTSPSSPEASPSPTAPSATTETGDATPRAQAPTVAVVLPARQAGLIEEIERERRAIEQIADAAIDKGVISQMRTVLPDRIATVGDVVELLAEEGHDLVCAFGPGAARAVRDAAKRFPGTRFCVAPGRLPDVPDNALVFDVRVNESAYLAGVAAGEAAAVVGGDAQPTLLVAESSVASRLQLAFDQGFALSRERPPDEATPVRVATNLTVAFDTASSLFESGTYLVYTSAGRVEQGVMDAAKGTDGLVISTFAEVQADDQGAGADAEGADGDDGATPDQDASDAPVEGRWNLMVLGQDLSAAFRDTLDELAAGWTGGSRSIGFRNGALTVTPGRSPVWERIAPQVLSVRDQLVAGADFEIAGS